ncbi:MAG: BatA domain-containing protein [Lentisphaeria bacterium]|nr:BatA domain-containing protein [Lentisphaeria bacterium]
MPGFFFIAGLLGLAAIAWPLYLHLRKQKKVTQVVPSLKLFGFSSKQAKKVRTEQLYLMAVRTMIFLLFALILAQPYLKSNKQLQLPRIVEDESQFRVVALLIDNAQTSLQPVDDASIFEKAKQEAISFINKSPSELRYVILTTSNPYAGDLKTAEKAISFIKSLDVSYKSGDAVSPIESFTDRYGHFPVGFIYFGVSSKSHWRSQFTEGSSPVRIYMHTYRTGSSGIGIKSAWVENNNLYIELKGRAAQLSEAKVSIISVNKELFKIDISEEQALQGKISYSLEALPETPIIGIKLEHDQDSPWNELFISLSEKEKEKKKKIYIIREEDPISIQLDRYFTEFFLTFTQSPSIEHLTINNFKDKKINSGLMIHLSRQKEQLQNININNENIIYFRQLLGEQPIIENIKWPARIESLPFKLQNQAEWLNIDSFKSDKVYQADSEVKTKILSDQNEKELVYIDENKIIVSLLHLNVNDVMNCAYHPFFPILLETLLINQNSNITYQPIENAGEKVNLKEFFGVENVIGQVSSPNGKTSEINTKVRKDFYLEEPGLYRLEETNQVHYAAANVKRPEDNDEVEPVILTQDMSFEVVELGNGEILPEEAYHLIYPKEKTGDVPPAIYSLSPYFAFLLAFFVFFESCYLLYIWRHSSGVGGDN